MILVGLTGGIGAGKSTVAQMLAERGAVIIDADAITRELQQKGTPVFAAIVGRFGEMILTPAGELDRAALAAIVFSDPKALADLNAIVHPAVREEMAVRIREAEKADASVVVLDIPLVAEGHGRDGMAHVITVEADPEIRIERLSSDRGMSHQDARNRISAQASREQREALADSVIENEGSLQELAARVDQVWDQISS